jgi:orotidine-5'-phosphate decarboxylase
VHEIAHVGLPIFLDLKLHDIPNTVAGAMQAIRVLEPAIVTVHASGGRAMMEDAKAAAAEHTKVVAVTMLTSLDERDLVRTGVGGTPRDHVLRLAELAQLAGLDGIVCSGREATWWCPACGPRTAPRGTRSASSPRARRAMTARACWSSAARSAAPTIRSPPRARSRRRFRGGCPAATQGGRLRFAKGPTRSAR